MRFWQTIRKRAFFPRRLAGLSLAFLLLILSGCGIFPGSCASAQTVIDSKDALYDEVETALAAGEEEISFETSELTKEELGDINKNISGFYGRVTDYQYQEIKLLGKSYVTLHAALNDNYYVEKAYLDGEAIPDDREKAKELYAVCERILESFGSKKKKAYTKEKKIHDYIVSRTAYGYPEENPDADSDAYSAYGALVLGKAVCNGYAQAMKLLCDLAGVTCDMVTGTADGESHAWNLVKLGEHWYHVDATWDDPEPDKALRVLYTYFNVDDTQMKRDHKWDTSRYQAADGQTQNYYRKKDLICEDYSAFRDKCEDVLEETGSPSVLQFQVKDYDKETYSEDALQFILKYSGASSMSMQVSGKKPYSVLYFKLSY